MMWPTSERTIYNEPQRLEKLGWATSSERVEGGRTATVYAITDDGRAALEAWLATEPDEPPLSSEMLLRVMHADHGSKDDLVAATRAAVDQWRGRFEDLLPVLRGYLDDGGPFPERLHLVGMLVGFGDRYVALLEEFADEVEAEAARWRDTQGIGMTPMAERRITEAIRRYSTDEAMDRASDA